MLDKQAMVQAARDALSITAEPCPKCGHPGGEQVVHICGPDEGERSERVGRTIDLSESTHGGKTLIVRINSVRWARMQALVASAIRAADRSGIGSDAVWEIAREIKRLREGTNA